MCDPFFMEVMDLFPHWSVWYHLSSNAMTQWICSFDTSLGFPNLFSKIVLPFDIILCWMKDHQLKFFLSKWPIPVNMKTCLWLLHQCYLLLFQINSRILPNLNLYPILPLFPSVFCSNISWISIFIVALTQLHRLLLFFPHFFFLSDLIFYFQASLLVHHFPFLQLYVCLTTLR